MLLEITTTQPPATDLGYLLHKNPTRSQATKLSFGTAHVFYPEASEERCTAAMLLDVDPVGLVRGGASTLREYVNDWPYVASSFLSVAIARVFGTALSGRSKERPELARTPIPMEARLAVVPSRGGEEVLRRLLEPLGYAVSVRHHPLDEEMFGSELGPYYTVELAAEVTLSDLLSHLYVLVPVLDDEKHYWVGEDEVEKLLRHGEGWLAGHPERAMISTRYLKHRRSLAREALERIVEEEQPDAEESKGREEEVVEERISLASQRIGAVISALKGCGARRVLDLGCGEGKLLRALIEDGGFEELVGMDVSHRSLRIAASRLRLDRLSPKMREGVRLVQGSLIYRDARLSGYDAAAVVEVVEHLDPPRLAAFERVLFEFARPRNVIVTTPNAEYNALFETLPAGRFRHRDHRFEWTRAEFAAWAEAVAVRHGYRVRYLPVGPEDPSLGAPTQTAVFSLDGDG